MLHCAIVEPGEQNYVYHLIDNAVHDPTFVNEVLEYTFRKWNITDETTFVKSDNALVCKSDKTRMPFKIALM